MRCLYEDRLCRTLCFSLFLLIPASFCGSRDHHGGSREHFPEKWPVNPVLYEPVAAFFGLTCCWVQYVVHRYSNPHCFQSWGLASDRLNEIVPVCYLWFYLKHYDYCSWNKIKTTKLQWKLKFRSKLNQLLPWMQYAPSVWIMMSLIKVALTVTRIDPVDPWMPPSAPSVGHDRVIRFLGLDTAPIFAVWSKLWP